MAAFFIRSTGWGLRDSVAIREFFSGENLLPVCPLKFLGAAKFSEQLSLDSREFSLFEKLSAFEGSTAKFGWWKFYQ